MTWFTARLIQIGNSIGVVIPKDDLKDHKPGDKVKVTVEWLE